MKQMRRTIIEVDPRTVLTHKIRWTKVYDFAKAMEAGAVFPPPHVQKQIGYFTCKDGAHRTVAHRLLGRFMRVRVAVPV